MAIKMLGNPKFNYNDKVSFKIDDHILTGRIYIIDRYGTFEDDTDVSYDVMVDSEDDYPITLPTLPCLFKHIKESSLLSLKDSV